MECQAHRCSWIPSPSPTLLPTESITIAHIAERRAVLHRIWSTRRFTPESIVRVQPVHQAADRDARRVELFGASVRGRVGHATVQAVQGPQIPQDPQRELLERGFARHLAKSAVHASTGARGDRPTGTYQAAFAVAGPVLPGGRCVGMAEGADEQSFGRVNASVAAGARFLRPDRLTEARYAPSHRRVA